MLHSAKSKIFRNYVIFSLLLQQNGSAGQMKWLRGSDLARGL